METATKQYVEYRDGEYLITGSRVLLDSLVYDFREGRSSESLRQAFPTLTLAEVFGALAFYLDHQAEIDAYLTRREEEYTTRYQAARAQDPEFYQRLEAICQKTELVQQ